jgi:hypothetical protein
MWPLCSRPEEAAAFPKRGKRQYNVHTFCTPRKEAHAPLPSVGLLLGLANESLGAAARDSATQRQAASALREAAPQRTSFVLDCELDLEVRGMEDGTL